MGVGLGTKRLATSFHRAESRLNNAIAESPVGKYFKLNARKSSFTKELRAGTTTFLTMAYIISVNAAILTDSGGPCSIHDPGFDSCLHRTNRDLVAATAISAAIGSISIGLAANLPFAIAPGMGSNAYFTYNMVGYHGSGRVPYRTALAAVMLEGGLFVALSALGLRGRLARMIPRPVRLASAAGMGLFLAFTGLQAHQGLGLVGPSKSTLVTLAACRSYDPINGECLEGVMRSPTFWLGSLGFLITSVGLVRKVNGSMIYGIVFVTLVSWIRGTSVTIFPDTTVGNYKYNYFRRVVDFHMIKGTAGAISFSGFKSSQVWFSIITLLYVDILDTTGSMYSMAEFAGLMNENGGFEGEYSAFITDASSTIVGAALGTTTSTTYLESTAGIKEGGRTGITAITVGVYFLLSLFFTPLLTSVPPWAIGPSLVLVGAMMMAMAKEIEWSRMKEGIPAFLTMILMPLTYSIANGIVAGLGVYVLLNMYDYAVELVGWGKKMRKMMAEARNRVSAASTAENAPACV